MHFIFRILWLVLPALLCARSEAQQSSVVLPPGVWMANYRFGIVDQVSNRFDSGGSLQSISRLNQAFSGENITKYSPELKEMTNLLGTFPHNGLVQQLSLGQLEFDANIQARYHAVVLARGITKNLTLGLGAPVLTIQGQVGVRQGGVNSFHPICSGFTTEPGALNTSFAEGCRRAQSVDLIQEYRKALQTNGYQEPTSVNRTVIGDLQIAGIYQYFVDKRWTLYNQTTATLPTGPEDDPSNFLDAPVFHQTQLKVEMKQDFRLNPQWTIGTTLGYLWRVPDRAEKRVPRGSDDILPPADRQERVRRDLGDSILLGGSLNFALDRVWSFQGIYEFASKSADRYSGSRDYDYSLLARDSTSRSHRVGAGMTFSTVDLFYTQEFTVPFQVGYQFSDVISGVNVDRQQTHEVSLRMFF